MKVCTFALIWTHSGMVYAMENGHEFWNMECWEICRFRSLKTGARELTKYKLCFGRVEEVRQNMLDIEAVGSLEVSTGQIFRSFCSPAQGSFGLTHPNSRIQVCLYISHIPNWMPSSFILAWIKASLFMVSPGCHVISAYFSQYLYVSNSWMNYFMVLIRIFKVILASEGWNRNVRHQFVIC